MHGLVLLAATGNRLLPRVTIQVLHPDFLYNLLILAHHTRALKGRNGVREIRSGSPVDELGDQQTSVDDSAAPFVVINLKASTTGPAMKALFI